MSAPSRAPLTLVVSRPRREASDAELARGLATAEDWAVTESWQRFAPMVLALAERALGSRSDAEDVAQDVFVRLVRTAPTLRVAESLRSFVYSIAIRTLKSHLRRRQLKAWLSFRGPETLVDLRYSTPDPEARDVLRKFYQLLDRLSPRDRIVFMSRRAESMTIDEIALALDISPSTVKRSLTHASARMAHWIDRDPELSELLDRKLRGGSE